MTTVPNFLDFTINAVLRTTFIRKLYYKLSSILTFTLMQIFDQNFVFFTEWRQSETNEDAVRGSDRLNCLNQPTQLLCYTVGGVANF